MAESIRRAVAEASPAFLSSLSGCRVLVKANFNSPHQFPATSDREFLAALVGLFHESGASRVRIGDSCGLRWAPAEEVHRALGIPGLCATAGAEWVNFDEGPWRCVHIPGVHYSRVSVADAAFETDVLVYAACAKTHRRARFSLSLKHTVGFLPPEERRALHDRHIEEKVADLNLAVTPDLVLIDARKCLVSGGPVRGWVRNPGRIIASPNRVAADVEGVRLLKSLFGLNRVRRDPRQNPQIRQALKLGLGPAGEKDSMRFSS